MGRFVILLLCAAPLVAAPVPKAKAKTPTLDGKWEVVERQNDGKPYPLGRSREFWTIDGGDIAMRFGADVTALKDPRPTPMTLEPPDADNPTALVITQPFPCGQTSTFNARVEFDGDTLHLAMPLKAVNGRPAAAKPGLGVSYIRFKKVDEAKLKAK